MEIGKDQIVKSIGSLIIGLLIFFTIFLFSFHWYTSDYNRYVFIAQVEDEDIFQKTLNPSDPQILDYGRKLKTEVIAIDNDKDHGNGPNSGKLRWYVCGGIDCDEGWEIRFIKER